MLPIRRVATACAEAMLFDSCAMRGASAIELTVPPSTAAHAFPKVKRVASSAAWPRG
jgi:hypothetical protein